ncbi:WD40/YVTN/BNR-like repeat-containing protein [Cohnella faecalis]|uniref:Photosynthesis system II assembly factor Ycf48/Hcf136-like domain-containing protein n=1 Tax=Cohnella faecalis TaxID=2315694 RepID=A0A398CJG1_9BACL|nr:hypothetical protein [Cohnella faecalis]RIE02272.1 hypothetical protein D3H35_16225 [Cohnella faecalis]
MMKTTLQITGACLLAIALLAGCSSNSESALPSSSSTAITALPTQPAASEPSNPAEGTEAASPEPTATPSTSPIGSIPLSTVTALRLATPLSGWAGGENWIARTDDGGKHWKKQYTHKGMTKQLFALNSRTAWATIGSTDAQKLTLLKTKDGGSRWTTAGTVPNDGFLHFVSETEAFSANAITIDGGKSWKTLGAPDHAIGDVYYHDRNNGWAVSAVEGADYFEFQRTTDGGKSWKTVFTRKTSVIPSDSVIRSAGKNDAWIELIGDSGMTQTSYSLFHTSDGGGKWQPVLANSGAGSGPAPGFAMDEKTVPRNGGNSPGELYVVNTTTAFMGGQCQACDDGNTMGKTTDGGKTWTNLKAEYPGYGAQHIAAADAKHVWWINTDPAAPSVMYTTADGGVSWKTTYTFATPKPSGK